MIFSMTGFGKATVDSGNKKITAEIKSLNSKQLDLSIRIPSSFREIELDLRSSISQKLERGKVDMFVNVTTQNGTEPVSINISQLQGYKKAIETMQAELGLEDAPHDWYTTLLRLPNVFTAESETEMSQDEAKAVKEAVAAAVARLIEFREQEGKKLEVFFAEKIARIKELLLSIEPYEQERIPNIKAKIEDSLSKLKIADYDKNRFEQELIYYIEKLDVTEEKLRLTNHLNYFLETMSNGEGQGKKLGFIAQEMGREINTLGSKSNHAEMQKIVVKMKDELEQIKEQVLNVL